VDSLLKEGMSDAQQQLLYVKDHFKVNPRKFVHYNVNIGMVYKEKKDREHRLGEKPPPHQDTHHPRRPPELSTGEESIGAEGNNNNIKQSESKRSLLGGAGSLRQLSINAQSI
jgi:hypothetical protein